MNPLMSEKVRVKIYGKEYEMDPGTLTPLEASQLAAYVDQKMKEIAEKLNMVDTQKIAVLAALNIAFELAQKARPATSLTDKDEVRIESMISSLDKSLK